MAGTLRARKHLSADALVACVRASFAQIPDHRPGKCDISLVDTLMSAFAMFSLKDPSLLAFEERRHDQNLQRLYGIGRPPSDTRMREVVDPVAPVELRPGFRDIFRRLQRGKVLEQYAYLEGAYLILLDGTTTFSSKKIHCDSCMHREHANGTVTYHHQMVGAVLAHPDKKEVIPLAPEPILNQDGQTKNDCERNAVRRWLEGFRREHPHLPAIIVEDALSSNGPHIQDLQEHRCRFILGVKPGDHAALFEEVHRREAAGEAEIVARRADDPKTRHVFSIVRDVPLNASHPDLKVTFVRYLAIDKETEEVHMFTWITDLKVTAKNVWDIMRGGRARWKVENETFNTLKNQGYHCEHNYGHGAINLSVVLAMIMMLAFLVDQVQQLCDPLFQAALEKLKTKRLLWERLRSLFQEYRLYSFREVYEALVYGLLRPRPRFDTS